MLHKLLLFELLLPVLIITSSAVICKSAESKKSIDEIVHSEAYKKGLDPALIKAVMMAESNYSCYAVSEKGACGLMQLMPETARCLGVKDIFSAKENISSSGPAPFRRVLSEDNQTRNTGFH